MTQREVVITGMARTAIGSFGGALKDVPLSTLATTVGKAALQRAGVAAADVGHVVMGNVIPTDPRDAYLSRVAAIDAGLAGQPDERIREFANRIKSSATHPRLGLCKHSSLSDSRNARCHPLEDPSTDGTSRSRADSKKRALF